MKKYTHIIFILCLCWLTSAMQAQNLYIKKYDVSGIIENSNGITQLQEKADELEEALPEEAKGNFKIYDAGFYVLKGYTVDDEYQKAFDALKANAAKESTYYIAIGRQSDSTGFYSRFFVEVNFPKLTGGCDFNPLAKAFLQNQINQNYEKLNRNPTNASLAIAWSLEGFKNYMTAATACCEKGEKIEQCATCKSQDGRKAYLSSLGFTAIAIQNIGNDNNPYLAPEIENKAQYLFTIDDLTAVDLGAKYKIVIDTFNKHNMKIKVFITKDENLCSPEWEEMLKIAKSGTYDVVYWHHFHHGGIGNEWLYTTAFINGASNLKGGEGDRFAANIIAALAGAATDFLMQVVVHYIFDEDIPSGTEGLKWAVGRVDKTEVAKSAVFGLFGINSKLEVVVNALASATRLTISTADHHSKNGIDYTYQWAAKDFGTYFLKSLATEGLGMLLGNSAAKAVGKLKAVPFSGWCKIARLINKRLGTMIPSCFVAGTEVITARGRVPIEELQPDDWVLSDATLSPHQFVAFRSEKFDNSDKNTELWANLSSPAIQTLAARLPKPSVGKDVLNIPLTPEYDGIDITPDTWKVVSLEVKKTDGTISEVKLLRPNTWFETEGLLQIGDSTWFSMPEMNISGMARVLSFSNTSIDTRSAAACDLLAQSYYPVLSTFKHKSDHVLYLAFTNSDKIGTTTEHPFWSIERDGWVAASELRQYEKVKTTQGATALDSLWVDFRTTEVYNLESWKKHNYCVGSGVIVHNDCSYIDELNDFLQNNFKLPASISRVGAKTSLGVKRIGNEIHLPDGRKIKISMFEMPDFTEFTLKILGKPMSFNVMTKQLGKEGRKADFEAANKELLKHIDVNDLVNPKKLLTQTDFQSSNVTLMVFDPAQGKKVAKTFTWHHHENAKTMMFVEQDVHFAMTHDGGQKMKDLNATNELDNLAEFIFGNPIFK